MDQVPDDDLKRDDDDFDDEEEIELGDASWGEVFSECCVHSCDEWAQIALGVIAR